MAKLLKGKPVADSITQECAEIVSKKITENGMAPGLAVVSVGDNSSSASYLRGILKMAEQTGVVVKEFNLDENINQDDLLEQINFLNEKDKADGILLMRPLPANSGLDEVEICEAIRTDKDVDCANSASAASAYLNNSLFAPCTAEACMKILSYYKIDVSGKNVVVVGRSLVVGKPLANLLINQNATVTLCHSKTDNIAKHTKNADIVLIATGTPKKFGAKYFKAGQIVIDAGINWDEESCKLVGDVDFDVVEPIVDAITPVPGGVGSVTSAVLISHVVR